MTTDPLLHLVPASAFDAAAIVEVRPFPPGRGGRWSRPDVGPLP